MKNDIVKMLKKIGAIITNSHIVLTSGKHTDKYINPDNILPHTKVCSEIGKKFAEKYKDKNIDVVVGPAIGGIIFAQWVAFHLSNLKGKEILGLFTEKTPDKNQVFDRGFANLVKDKNVLVVEDITTTGESVKKAADSVKICGGKVVSVCVIINRDPNNVNSKTIGYPFSWLDVVRAKAYDEKKCPLCKKNIPINILVGHGKKYLETKKHNI